MNFTFWLCSSVRKEGSAVTVRYVSDGRIIEQSAGVQAALEDAYLYMAMEHGRKKQG